MTPFIPPQLRTAALAALGFSFLLIVVAVVPWYAAVLAALVALGVVSVAYSTTTNTTLQLESGESYRGRILSLYTLLFMGTTPIGGGITGLLADTWGVEVTLAVEGGVCLLATLLGLLYLRRLTARRAAAVESAAST